jgi:hypothetical protein
MLVNKVYLTDMGCAMGAAEMENEMLKTASWVIRNKVTKEVLFETFSPEIASAVNREKYEAVPILEHLVSLNNPCRFVGYN